MKITAERDALLKPLQAVVGVNDARNVLPILASTLFEIGEGRLTMTCSDTSLQICASVPMQDAAPQSFTSPTHKLRDIISRLPEGEAVTLDPNGAKLRVASGGSRFTLATLPARDFPKMQAEASACEAQVSARVLKQALGLVLPAMARRDIRYYLMGALVQLSPAQLRLTASDGYRLAIASCEVQCESEARVILPHKTCAELEKLLPTTDDQVRISLSSANAQIAFGSIEMTSALVEGVYPDLSNVLQVEEAQPILINRERLQAALQRAVILTDRFPGARFRFSEGTLRIDVKNGASDEATEELSGIDYHGEPLEMGFNCNYVLDALPAFGNEIEVSFFGTPKKLQVTLPHNSAWRHIVMSANV